MLKNISSYLSRCISITLPDKPTCILPFKHGLEMSWGPRREGIPEDQPKVWTQRVKNSQPLKGGRRLFFVLVHHSQNGANMRVYIIYILIISLYPTSYKKVVWDRWLTMKGYFKHVSFLKIPLKNGIPRIGTNINHSSPQVERLKHPPPGDDWRAGTAPGKPGAEITDSHLKKKTTDFPSTSGPLPKKSRSTKYIEVHPRITVPNRVMCSCGGMVDEWVIFLFLFHGLWYSVDLKHSKQVQVRKVGTGA